jgi:hypothetical protein
MVDVRRDWNQVLAKVVDGGKVAFKAKPKW